MPLAIGSFTAFAGLLAAACRLGPGAPGFAAALARIAAGAQPEAVTGVRGLDATVAAMARAAEDHARHFTHPGRARDDAIAVFFQVASSAFADPAAFAAGCADPGLTAARMAASVRAGPMSRDFAETVLAAPFLLGATEAALAVMRARGG